ncbi:hypothetical protein MAR_009261 [Mya arenaria]|uniref:Uncharacterized protein n=1 Tax=Mya arenaria TaxID=6604 RepID=A0ABY7DYA2_MYAAR|nr:hypothetical protein MAR_009261 [Mya arenaria]
MLFYGMWNNYTGFCLCIERNPCVTMFMKFISFRFRQNSFWDNNRYYSIYFHHINTCSFKGKKQCISENKKA